MNSKLIWKFYLIRTLEKVFYFFRNRYSYPIMSIIFLSFAEAMNQILVTLLIDSQN